MGIREIGKMLTFHNKSLELNNLLDLGLITPDAKNRISIGSILNKSNIIDVEGFRAFIAPSGTIVLLPIITVPAHEAWLYKNPEALASVDRGIKDMLAGKVGPLSRLRLKKK